MLRTTPRQPPPVDAGALATDLARVVHGEVRFDAGSRALYATDASNYRQIPIGVVLPRDADDLARAVAVAAAHEAPILPRGGGTSLAGQCCNVAVVLDTSKYMAGVLELDAAARRARVQPGCVLDTLRESAERAHLTFGPDPSTHDHCTLGGMLGNNSCGVHSVAAEFYGPGPQTSDSVQELEVLTVDGLRLRVGPTPPEALARILAAGGRRAEIYRRLVELRDRYAGEIRRRFPRIPRRVSGYNLPALLPEHGFDVARALVGSEGTCVTILEATLSLIASPRARALLVLGYPSVYEAGDDIPAIRESRPIGLEGLDDRLVGDMKRKGLHPRDVDLLPEGGGWLLVEFGGETRGEAEDRARELQEVLRRRPRPPSMKLFTDPTEEKIIWTVRESGLGATARVPGRPDTWEGWEDSAVPPDRLGRYLRELRHLFERYGYDCALYGHFGQGCVHTRIDFDLLTADGIRRFRSFLGEAADLVVSLGGSLSGEHGDGQSRAELLPRMFGAELMRAFQEFKAIWDPRSLMNPGKVIDAYRVDENLRLGTGYEPRQPATHFKFPGDDHGSFARATLRCVGVGDCRKQSHGTMCPSYMATREEMHSTRGRARLLFEMLEGEVITDGWRSEAVKHALDLCLGCKACKSECPINVDMATYKAEFLSHHYARRLRPRPAYAFGLIAWWARVAAWAPSLVNALMRAPVTGAVSRRLAGMTAERRVPAFAPRTFRSWFRGREVGGGERPPVLLWPDTFNDHFHPETAIAAVEVLESAGFRVIVPEAALCCGRPLYDYGMLDLARHWLRRIIDALRPHIAAGVPLVALEPSCLAVFRDEMLGLFPEDPDAQRLAGQSFLLGEFLARRAPHWSPPALPGHALVHGHCHQKSILGMTDDLALLRRLGLDLEVPDSGCCGMAGAFGFEADKYDVSVQIGERVLLPAVRAAAADTLIVADGFSCREQIGQLTDRRPLHLAEVLQLALQHERLDGDGHPEARYLARHRLPAAPLGAGTVGLLGAAALVTGAVLGTRASRR